MPRVDFTSQDYLRDPAAGLTKLRAAGPVVQVRFPIIGKTWITTTNDLAGRVLKDSETFSMRQNGRVAGLRWWMPGWLRTLAVSMLTMDEPDHTRLRSIVDEAFRRRQHAWYENELTRRGVPYAAAEGPVEMRMATVKAVLSARIDGRK